MNTAEWLAINRGDLEKSGYSIKVTSSEALFMIDIDSSHLLCQIIEKMGQDAYFEIMLMDAETGDPVILKTKNTMRNRSELLRELAGVLNSSVK